VQPGQPKAAKKATKKKGASAKAKVKAKAGTTGQAPMMQAPMQKSQ
jgi:hypothetical protein